MKEILNELKKLQTKAHIVIKHNSFYPGNIYYHAIPKSTTKCGRCGRLYECGRKVWQICGRLLMSAKYQISDELSHFNSKKSVTNYKS